MKKILLLALIVMTFTGCATESDPDRLSWDEAKRQLESSFGKESPEMTQAKEAMQGLSETQNQAGRNF